MSLSPKPVPNPPSPLFHGTYAVLKPGDLLVPGREAGTSRGHFVWMTESHERARVWALHGHVYEVAPEGPVEDARGSYRTTRARVIREVRP